MLSVAILDSAYRGGHYSKITFIARPLHITLHFLHLCTLKIGLKLHVCVLKILGLAMPMHISTFHQDFPQLNFHQGSRGPPLKLPMNVIILSYQHYGEYMYEKVVIFTEVPNMLMGSHHTVSRQLQLCVILYTW